MNPTITISDDYLLLDQSQDDDHPTIISSDRLKVKTTEPKRHTQHIEELHQFDDEDDIAIRQWKDSRLKKLEDFTRDLKGRGSSQKRQRRDSHVAGSEMTTLKNDTQQDYITLSSNQVQSATSSSFHVTNNNLPQAILNATTCMGATASEDGNYDTNGVVGNTTTNDDEDQEYRDQVIDEPYYCEGVDNDTLLMEDDLMLTKTEGSQMLKFNSNACSTQRSNFPLPSSSQSVNGEFEKRITDIKQKLTQIKNTINNEIENSFTQQQSDNGGMSDYNSNVMSPQIITSQRQPLQNLYHQQQQQLSQKSQQNTLKQNSVVSSLDQFQVKLNTIKQNINKVYDDKQQLLPQTKPEEERDRFNRIKSLIDNSFHQTPSSKQGISTGHFSQASFIENPNATYQQQRLHSIPISLEQTVSVANSLDLKSPTTMILAQPVQQSDKVVKENAALKQKLNVMAQTVLNKKMDQLYLDQQREKDRYEEQLTKMQEEMGKMCEVIQDIGKKRHKSANSKKGCSKKLRIATLEKQIKELQYQLLNQNHMSNSMVNTSQSVVKAIMNSTQQSMATQESQKDINLSKRGGYEKGGNDKQKLEFQVSHLELKLKKFHQDLQDNTQSQLLKDQLNQQMQENEAMRENYTQQYQSLLEAFETFKRDMEVKMQHQEAMNQQRDQELSLKDKQIQQLKKENVFLREKIGKIKDVFDYQRTPRDQQQQQQQNENYNQMNTEEQEHVFDETVNIQIQQQQHKQIHPMAMTKGHSKKKLSNGENIGSKSSKGALKKKVKIVTQQQQQQQQVHKLKRRGSSAKILVQRV